MNFYHQDNVLCNTPEQFRTSNVEVEFLLVLPRQMPLLPPKCVGLSDADNDYYVPCWLVKDGESDADAIGIGGPPHVVHVDNTNEPDIDVLKFKFGMLYTSAHVIETRD
jgi:hypothetical protein